MPDKKITLLFITWRLALFLVALISPLLIPNFGSQFPYYDKDLLETGLPDWLRAFGNFDGVHYLKLVKEGYQAALSQVFFPLFPLSIKMVSAVIPVFISGLIITNVAALGLLLIVKRLYQLDYNSEVAKKSLILLFCFPTTFYLGSLYPESLFLFLTVGGLYLARRGYWTLGALSISLASATKVFGLASILSYYIEVYSQRASLSTFKITLLLAIPPLGLIFYMVYLWLNFGDPLLFVSSQELFGANRSSNLVLLPQTLYRYLNIFLSVPVSSHIFIIALVELLFALLVIGLLVASFSRIRFSYWVFVLVSFLLPSLTGTFQSIPRYALTTLFIFPLIVKLSGRLYWLVVLISLSLELIFLSYFIRGYWIS